jgi:DNA end-binding protein Ku
VSHSREHLGIINPHAKILVLEQMRLEDQIAAWNSLHVPEHESIRAKELSMATSFIDHLTEHFKPSDYKDTFHSKLKALIRLKLKGHAPKVVKEKLVSPTKSADLMAMLRESLEKAKKNPQAFAGTN